MLLKKRATRNLPIKIICPNTRHRIINQVIYEEFIYSLWERKSNWAGPAKERLLKYDIDVSETLLRSYKRLIKKGSRDPVSASNFSGDLFGGTYASRYGKDSMYNQFYLWEGMHLDSEELVYVGLPANQILSVNRHYGALNVFACEKSKPMAQFMFDMQRHFSDSHARIVNEDIFEFLKNTETKFSVFDFDLMCHANAEGLLEKIAEAIIDTARDRAVINIATTIGRWIDKSEYKYLMPHSVIEGIECSGFEIVGTYSGEYNDRIIPMRYEFLAIMRR